MDQTDIVSNSPESLDSKHIGQQLPLHLAIVSILIQNYRKICLINLAIINITRPLAKDIDSKPSKSLASKNINSKLSDPLTCKDKD